MPTSKPKKRPRARKVERMRPQIAYAIVDEGGYLFDVFLGRDDARLMIREWKREGWHQAHWCLLGSQRRSSCRSHAKQQIFPSALDPSYFSDLSLGS